MTQMSPAQDPYAIEKGMILCSMKIRASRNSESNTVSYKVTFPADLEHARIVYREDSVIWFCDTFQGQVLVSDQKEPWRSKKRFDQFASTSVSKQRVTTIPRKLFEGYTSPYSHPAAEEADRVDESVFQLRNEHLYYAVSPPECLAKHGSAFFVPVEDIVAIHGFDIAQRRSKHDIEPFLTAVEDDKQDTSPEDDLEEQGGEPA